MSFERLCESHTPEGVEIFLDTSIHCSRLKGPLYRDRVMRTLGFFRWISTSSYAKVEFGNVVLSTGQYLLNKIDRYKSLRKALDFVINRLDRKFHGKKFTWTFNLLADNYGSDDDECTVRARASLRRLLKVGVKFVEELSDRPIADGTKCYWADNGLRQGRDGSLEWRTPDCKRSRKRCKVDEFFLANQNEFVSIKLAIDNLNDASEQLREFSSVISQALKDPQCLLDYRAGCRRLADALIAVDCKSIGCRNFFTVNRAESDLLCKIMQQNLYYLPQEESEGVLLKRRSTVQNASGGAIDDGSI